MMKRSRVVVAVVVLIGALELPALGKQAEAIDIVFALDTTGSMSREIAHARKLVWELANVVVQGDPAPTLRLALIRYRDVGDAYVVKVTPLTRDLDAVHKVLMGTKAGGGGDRPEHVSRALHEAAKQRWRPGARKLIFLIGDAPPSNRGDFDWRKEAPKAKASGATIYAIGCLGIGRDAKIFRRIAALGGGQYSHLDRGAGSSGAFRNKILTLSGLGRYVTKASALTRVAVARQRVVVDDNRRDAPPKAPASKDVRDRSYAPTPDRIWRSKIE